MFRCKDLSNFFFFSFFSLRCHGTDQSSIDSIQKLIKITRRGEHDVYSNVVVCLFSLDIGENESWTYITFDVPSRESGGGGISLIGITLKK